MASEENGVNDEVGSDEGEQASFNVLGQYIKDLSFESPHAPGVLQGRIEKPNLEISVNVNAENIADDQFEVVINFEGKASTDTNTIYNIELVYGGVFRLINIPDHVIRPMLLVDCPALLFPFVRRIVSDITRDGGFPPLMLDPIDFAGLYRANIEQEKEGMPSEMIN